MILHIVFNNKRQEVKKISQKWSKKSWNAQNRWIFLSSLTVTPQSRKKHSHGSLIYMTELFPWIYCKRLSRRWTSVLHLFCLQYLCYSSVIPPPLHCLHLLAFSPLLPLHQQFSLFHPTCPLHLTLFISSSLQAGLKSIVLSALAQLGVVAITPSIKLFFFVVFAVSGVSTDGFMSLMSSSLSVLSTTVG